MYVVSGATAEYPAEIESGERASRLRVKFLWGYDLRTRQFAMCWLRVEPRSENEAISYVVATRLRVATRQN